MSIMWPKCINISSLVSNSRYFPKFALNSVAVTTMTKSSFFFEIFLLYAILWITSIKSCEIRRSIIKIRTI